MAVDQMDLFGEPVQTEVALSAQPASWSYCRRRVPSWACELAILALRAYCAETGQRLGPFRFNGRPSDALLRVTGAVLDHPEITREQWQSVIGRTLRAPWWDGPPSVGCVFGPAVVEKNIAAAQSPARSVARLTSNGALLRALES